MLVSILLTMLFLALVQLCIILYVRNVMVSSAAEGARYGANADLVAGADTDEAKARTEKLIADGIPGSIKPTVASTVDGEWIEVDVSAPVPMFGLFGPADSLTITVTGHALKEGR
ncbi:MAG: putative TadE-like family protein [Frankiales bacterium]|nr:putative TadE-like family protein [Frankiales bacterium]